MKIKIFWRCSFFHPGLAKDLSAPQHLRCYIEVSLPPPSRDVNVTCVDNATCRVCREIMAIYLSVPDFLFKSFKICTALFLSFFSPSLCMWVLGALKL